MLGNGVNPNGLCHQCAGQAAAVTQPAPQRQADRSKPEAIPKVFSRRRGRPETGVLRKERLCGLFDLHGLQARSEHSSRGCHIQPRALASHHALTGE